MSYTQIQRNLWRKRRGRKEDGDDIERKTKTIERVLVKIEAEESRVRRKDRRETVE